jgi:hypothetical protein
MPRLLVSLTALSSPRVLITQISLPLSKATLKPLGDQAAPLSCAVLFVSGGLGSSGTGPPGL